MNRSALLEKVKQDRKASIKMLEGDRLRVRFQQSSHFASNPLARTQDSTRGGASIFKQFILATESYPLN
jgi:hypothetical protein